MTVRAADPYRDLDVFQGVILVARGDRILLEKGYGLANVELSVANTPARTYLMVVLLCAPRAKRD